MSRETGTSQADFHQCSWSTAVTETVKGALVVLPSSPHIARRRNCASSNNLTDLSRLEWWVSVLPHHSRFERTTLEILCRSAARTTTKISEEINKRFQEEMLFDQLVTTVIEWHEAMVKFAARSDAASVSSYPTMLKKIRECNVMLRIANILSTALSFTENIEDDRRHNKHECGKPICTIARELRNRIQHSSIRPHARWRLDKYAACHAANERNASQPHEKPV